MMTNCGFILNGLVLRACLEGFTVNGRQMSEAANPAKMISSELSKKFSDL
jgi:hypothetical protein